MIKVRAELQKPDRSCTTTFVDVIPVGVSASYNSKAWLMYLYIFPFVFTITNTKD